MLVRLEGIDGHLPALDDPLAMQVVLRDYEPQLVERGCMLWTRRADAPRTSARSRPLVLERTGTLGEWLELGELSGAAHVATIEIEPSWLGRAKRAAYQADALVLQVRSANGDIQVSRAPPTSLRTSFILDPMLNDHFAFVRWVSGVPVGRARAVRLIEYADAGGAFAKSFKLRIERAEELAPEPPPDAEKRFVYAMFDVKPDFVRSTSEATSTIMGDREALVVYAPSEMSFSVAPGRYVLRGMFGLGPNVLAGAVSDGVTFSAVLDGESKPIFQRHIDPVHVPAERGLFPFKYEFTAQRATQLVLRTHPGSRNDRTDDSACWSGLKIEPLGR
jgi:hypothetical protein